MATELDNLPDEPTDTNYYWWNRKYCKKLVREITAQKLLFGKRLVDGKARLWLRHYLEREGSGFFNAAESARLAGYKGGSDSNYFKVMGYRNKYLFREAILDWANEQGGTFEDAMLKLIQLTEDEDHKIQLGAAKTIIDAKGYGAAQKIKHELSIEDALRALRGTNGSDK